MLNRRKLILALAPAAILPTASTTSTAAVNETRNADFVPSFFSPDEWRFINAAVARLIPGDGNGPGGIETGVPEFIDRQMELPYGHGAYFYMQGPFHPERRQRSDTNSSTRLARSIASALRTRTRAALTAAESRLPT